jgi:hypothetical protein
MLTPTPTATLEKSSASVPAARLVIQNRWSLTVVASTASVPRTGSW